MSKYLRVAVSVLLLGILAWRTNWSEVGAKFADLRVGMWFAAVALCALAQLAGARRWQLFARELQFDRSLPQYGAFYFIGMYFNLVLPTSVGGDVMRVWYLNGNTGRKWAALASVFLERLTGLVVLIGVACAGTLLSPVELPWWIVASVCTIAAGAFLCLAALPILQHWQRLSHATRRQLTALLALLRPPRILAESTLMSILVQAMGVLILWCLGRGLGLTVPITYYCILGPMVSLLMLLPLSVNGMGVREYGTVLFLAPLGVEEPAALALACLWFTVSATVSLLGGLVYLFVPSPKTASSHHRLAFAEASVD